MLRPSVQCHSWLSPTNEDVWKKKLQTSSPKHVGIKNPPSVLMIISTIVFSFDLRYIWEKCVFCGCWNFCKWMILEKLGVYTATLVKGILNSLWRPHGLLPAMFEIGTTFAALANRLAPLISEQSISPCLPANGLLPRPRLITVGSTNFANHTISPI